MGMISAYHCHLPPLSRCCYCYHLNKTADNIAIIATITTVLITITIITILLTILLTITTLQPPLWPT